MKQFTLYWLSGISELMDGNNIDEVIANTIKKGKVVYYSEGNSLGDYQYNRTDGYWEVQPNKKFNLEFYPLESTESKDKDGNTIRSFHIDDSGKNLLMVKSNNKLSSLTLKLGTLKQRRIGVVTKSTRTIEMFRKKDSHTFVKINGYGFNYFILKNQTSVDWIRLSDDTGSNWKIPVSYIVNNGSYMQFKKVGFELQKFVSFNEIEQFRVAKSENRRFKND